MEEIDTTISRLSQILQIQIPQIKDKIVFNSKNILSIWFLNDDEKNYEIPTEIQKQWKKEISDNIKVLLSLHSNYQTNILCMFFREYIMVYLMIMNYQNLHH